MSTALAERPVDVTGEQLDLVRKTVANGATDAELKLFLFDCARRGVHPLDKLLHFTKRGGKYTPVTSIDFMRSQAAMSGEMAGSDDAVFVEGEAHPLAASVTVYRMTQGQRFSYSATARWSEYCPDNAPMWRRMPFTMLGKCAEALALRKAFPQQLAGLYTSDEMGQADNGTPQKVAPFAPSAEFVDTTTGEVLPAKPDGYAEWLMDLEAAAGNGVEALREAWKASPEKLRRAVDKTVTKALKDRAELVPRKPAVTESELPA